MLAKLTALLSSKVAIAAVGAVLVIGGGATVAAAETGHLPDNVTIPGITHSQQNTHENDQDDQGGHAHTIAIEGTLSAFDSKANTITVTGKADDQGDDQDSDNDNDSDDKGSSTPTTANPTPVAHDGTSNEGDSSTPTPGASSTPTSADPKCTITSPVTVSVNGSTKYNGQAKSEADLANDIGHQVQVQATATDCKSLTAWKVTVGGKGDDGSGDHEGKAFAGTVGNVNVGASSFMLQPEHGSALKVNVSSTTKFGGGLHGIGDLKSGMHALVAGTQQSDGSINATEVAAEGSDDHSAGQGQRTEISGQIAGTPSGNSFVVTTEDSHNVTVHVSSSTVYYGDAKGFGDLKAGMQVAAAGATQSDGSLQATQVAAAAAISHE